MKDNFSNRLKLFMILNGILIPTILLIAFIFSIINGTSFLGNLHMYFYGVGVIVLITAIPSLYRRPYSKRGMYRKMMGDIISFKSKGFNEEYVENNSYSDDNPFSTGLFVVLVGMTLLITGFILEKIMY